MLEREEEAVCRGRSVSNARRLRIIAARAHIPMSAVALAPSRDARRWLDKSSAPTYELAARERAREGASSVRARIARSHAATQRERERSDEGIAGYGAHERKRASSTKTTKSAAGPRGRWALDASTNAHRSDLRRFARRVPLLPLLQPLLSLLSRSLALVSCLPPPLPRAHRERLELLLPLLSLLPLPLPLVARVLVLLVVRACASILLYASRAPDDVARASSCAAPPALRATRLATA